MLMNRSIKERGKDSMSKRQLIVLEPVCACVLRQRHVCWSSLLTIIPRLCEGDVIPRFNKAAEMSGGARFVLFLSLLNIYFSWQGKGIETWKSMFASILTINHLYLIYVPTCKVPVVICWGQTDCAVYLKCTFLGGDLTDNVIALSPGF